MLYKLKAKRVEKVIKQGILSKQLGITPQYLGKIEKGEVEPSKRSDEKNRRTFRGRCEGTLGERF